MRRWPGEFFGRHKGLEALLERLLGDIRAQDFWITGYWVSLLEYSLAAVRSAGEAQAGRRRMLARVWAKSLAYGDVSENALCVR